MAPETPPPEVPDGRPPFFKSWNGAYVFVLAWLVVDIVVFAIIARVYA